MVERVTCHFMLLTDESRNVFSREDFARRDGFAHQTKGGVIGAKKTVLAQDFTASKKRGPRKIIKSKRNNWGLGLDSGRAPSEPQGETPL